MVHDRTTLVSKWSATIPSYWQVDPNAKALGKKSNFLKIVTGFRLSEKAYVQVRFRKCEKNCDEFFLGALSIQESVHENAHMCLAQELSCAPWLPVVPSVHGHVCEEETTKQLSYWGENGLRLLVPVEGGSQIVDATERQKIIGVGGERLSVTLVAPRDEYARLKPSLDAFIDSIQYEATIENNWTPKNHEGWKTDEQFKVNTTDSFDNLQVVAGYSLASGGYVQVRQGPYQPWGTKNLATELQEKTVSATWSCCLSQRCERGRPPLNDLTITPACGSYRTIEFIGKATAQFARAKFVRESEPVRYAVDGAMLKTRGPGGKQFLTLVVLTTKAENYPTDKLQLDSFLASLR